MRKPRQRPRQRSIVLRLAALLVVCSTFAMPSASAAEDVDPPTVVDFSFTPSVVDVGSGHQFITVTAHLVDQTGAKAPMLGIGTDGPPSSQQTIWFSFMELVSGTPQDGVWETQAYIPPSTEDPRVVGSWPVWLDTVSDTVGNYGEPVRHPTELTVLDSSQASPPGPPTSVTALAGDASAQVSWVPGELRGAAISGYTVTATPGGRSCATDGATTCRVTGLTNGTSYSFTVVAHSSVGSSKPSTPSGPVTPTASTTPTVEPTPTAGPTPTPTGEPTPTPTAPVPTAVPLSPVPADAAVPGRTTKPRVAVRGRRAVVRWSKPATNGAPITMYLVDVSRGRDQLVASGRRASLRKLQPGRYRVRVAAVNAIGRAAFSRWVRFTIR